LHRDLVDECLVLNTTYQISTQDPGHRYSGAKIEGYSMPQTFRYRHVFPFTQRFILSDAQLLAFSWEELIFLLQIHCSMKPLRNPSILYPFLRLGTLMNVAKPPTRSPHSKETGARCPQPSPYGVMKNLSPQGYSGPICHLL
jgi:hypothetical protein